MARLTLTVAGRDYDLGVRDGDETRFRALALIVDEKARQAAQGVGGLTETRQLLFAALLLADELEVARAAARTSVPAPAVLPPATPDPAAIERLAERAEALAERLERGLASS